MSAQVDLKELEKKAFKSNFEDGLWDAYLGVLLLQISLSTVLYELDIGPGWAMLSLLLFTGLALLAFWAMKKYVVTPRMGLVTFGDERQKKKKKAALIMSLSVLLGVVVLALTIGLYVLAVRGESANLGRIGAMVPFAIFAVNAVVVFSLIAYYYDFSRAYLYGWFYGLAYPLNIWLDKAFGIWLPLFSLAFSLIMVGVGLVLFVRFLRSHPNPVMEMVHDHPEAES